MLFSLTRRNLNLNYFTECLQLSTSRSELPVKINLSIKRYRRVETKCHVNKKQKKKKNSVATLRVISMKTSTGMIIVSETLLIIKLSLRK